MAVDGSAANYILVYGLRHKLFGFLVNCTEQDLPEFF